MKLLVIPFVFTVCTVIFITKVTAHEQESLHRDSEHRHANFVEHRNTILDVRIMKSIEVHDALYCGFRCLGNSQCISYKSAVFPDANGKFQCQLLATDNYRSSKSLKSSRKFHHYSIMVSRTFWLLRVHLWHLYKLAIDIYIYVFFLQSYCSFFVTESFGLKKSVASLQFLFSR